MKLIIGFLLLALLFGCLAPPTEPVPEPQINPVPKPQPTPNINIVDQNLFEDTNVSQDVDPNSINIDFNNNIISFNFEVDLNSPNLDVNVLTNTCSYVCSGLKGGDSWIISKDVNFGTYYCTCTACYDQIETDTRITKYCNDHKFGFEVTEKRKNGRKK